MEEIEVTGVDPAAILAALYNNAWPQGLGILQAKPGQMTREEAEVLISEARERSGRPNEVRFDYVHGRPLKVGFSERDGKTFLTGPWLYDRDQGAGECARIIGSLKSKPG